MKIAILVLFLVSLSSHSFAQYFGKFEEGPSGKFRDAEPWQEFVLASDFSFLDPNGLAWNTPKGTAVNGASIPPMFWSLIGGPFSGKYLKASVIHDHYVETKTRTAHDTHRNFYYGMRANDVPVWQAKAMYWAVRTFGEDWRLEKPAAEVPTAQNFSKAADVVRVEQIGAAIARQSLLEVARNLKTSEGQIVRRSFHGLIGAELADLDADALATQRALSMYAPLWVSTKNPEFQALVFQASGLTDSQDLTLDNMPDWPGGELPLSGGKATAKNFRDLFQEEQIRDFDFKLPQPG